MRKQLAIAAILGLLLPGCGHGPANTTESSTAAIESALRQWPHDFNSRNLPAVCGLFADDAVLVYPGAPDRDRKSFCDRIGAMFADPAKRYTYAEPEIAEILVDRDLATVRLVWTLTVADASGRTLETSREDGLDVFRRQADGSWRIRISHAFPH